MNLKHFIALVQAQYASTGDLEKAKESALKTLGDGKITDDDGAAIDIKDIDFQVKQTKTETKSADEPKTEDLVAKATEAARLAVREELKAMTLTADVKRPKAPTGSEKFTIPATVKRYGRLKNFKGTVGDFDAPQRAYRFGMWCMAAMGKGYAKDFCDRWGLKLHQEGVNTQGGYLVPEEFGNDMIDLRETYGVARRVFKTVPMMSDTRSDPRRTGGLTANFVGEGAIIAESTKSWDRVDLTAKKLAVLARITTELNEDAMINVGDDLAGEIAYAFSEKEDQCGFNGDGTATYGGIVGVRTRLSTINGVDDGGGLVLGADETWGGLTLEDFNKMIGRLPHYADTPNTVWVAHRAFFFGVMQKLETAAGGNSITEIENGTRGRFRFLGYPVEISQVYPAATAVSSIPVTFGDHSLAVSFGDRRQDTIKFTEDGNVGGQNAFEYDFIGVRGTERFDINVHSVGTSTTAGPVVGLITAAS